MTKVILVTCIFFLVLYLRNAIASGAEVEQKRKNGNEKYSLWFGPRVGRKKRNPSEDILRNVDSNDIQTLISFIKKNPWTVILLSTGESDSGKPSKDTSAYNRGDQIEVVPRFSPYVPRLGRAMALYPRINKENEVY